MTDNYKPRIAEKSANAKIAHQYAGSRTKQSSLSQVTAHVGMRTMFTIDIFQLCDKGKSQSAHSLEATVKHPKMERQNERTYAKIYGQARIQRIEVNARGFNLR